MSARQLRRLQTLVKTSTGADDDDGADDAVNYPSAMKVPKKSKKSAKRQNTTEEHAEVETQRHEQQQQQQQQKQQCELTSASSLVEKEDSQGKRNNEGGECGGPGAKKKKSGDLGKTGSEDKRRSNKKRKEEEEEEAVTMTDGVQEKDERIDEQQQHHKKNKKQRNRNTKAKRHELEQEEELLLEAALRQREEDACFGGTRIGVTGGGGDDETDLLELLSLCDPKRLDTRDERIRRFGVHAVEDVGDGRVPQRRAESRPTSLLFAEHPHSPPHFLRSLLATPNRYCWPHYDGLGVSLVVEGTKGGQHNKKANVDENNTNDGGFPLVYYFNDSTAEARRADMALALCDAFNNGMDAILTALAAAPYHIPTLILASNVFETMGSIPRAQEVIDIALYHVGVLLARFPVRQTARRRCLPFSIHSNKQLFQVLRCGIHQALRKAATRTAWEIAKLIYSLDDVDPFGMLLQLDYLALRAKQWSWLVHVHFIMTRELECKKDEDSKDDGGDADDKNVMWPNRRLALALSTLPGFFFSVALAKYFLEREEALSLSSKGPNTKKSSKVIREMTPKELYAFRNTPPAVVMLACAINRFPSAAVLLVEKIGNQAVVGSTPPPSWQNIVKMHESIKDDESLYTVGLWVSRNAEIWKAADPLSFLQRIITEDDGLWIKSNTVSNNNNNTVSFSVTGHNCPPWKHASLKEEDIMGQTLIAIPAHLLNANELTEEDLRDEARRATRQNLRPLDHITLLRFQALYGPLSPPTLSPGEQLVRYNAMFEEDGRERQIGGEHNPISLFFRTFLPWNSTREIALREALASAGIPDPGVAFNNQRHMEDEVLWQREEEEQHDGGDEEDGWETEESWYSDRFVVEESDDEFI